MIGRRLITTMLVLMAPGVIVLSAGHALAAPHTGSAQQITAAHQVVSRDEAIRRLALARASIDETLERWLIDDTEWRLADTGLDATAVVSGQSFLNHLSGGP